MIYDSDFIEIRIIDQEIIDDMLKFYSKKLQENDEERKNILEIIEQLKEK